MKVSFQTSFCGPNKLSGARCRYVPLVDGGIYQLCKLHGNWVGVRVIRLCLYFQIADTQDPHYTTPGRESRRETNSIRKGKVPIFFSPEGHQCFEVGAFESHMCKPQEEGFSVSQTFQGSLSDPPSGVLTHTHPTPLSPIPV